MLAHAHTATAERVTCKRGFQPRTRARSLAREHQQQNFQCCVRISVVFFNFLKNAATTRRSLPVRSEGPCATAAVVTFQTSTDSGKARFLGLEKVCLILTCACPKWSFVTQLEQQQQNGGGGGGSSSLRDNAKTAQREPTIGEGSSKARAHTRTHTRTHPFSQLKFINSDAQRQVEIIKHTRAHEYMRIHIRLHTDVCIHVGACRQCTG